LAQINGLEPHKNYRGPPNAGLYRFNLEKPTADYALLAAAPQQSLKHTNHVKSSSPLRFLRVGSTHQVNYCIQH